MHGRHTTPGGRETWPWVASKLHMCMVRGGDSAAVHRGPCRVHAMRSQARVWVCTGHNALSSWVNTPTCNTACWW